MKRFILNVLILSIPLVLYLIAIAVIDPYNYLNVSKVVDKETRYNISRNVEPHLYKLIEFENYPLRNITLGDSRTNSLFESMDYETWSNLAFRGGTLKEMVQAFWWTVEEHELDTVLIGLNLNLYNKYNKKFWVEETIETKKNFFSYAFNKYTFKSAFLITKSFLSKKDITLLETTLSKEQFWETQISDIPHKFFEKIAYPDNYFKDLCSISDYCEKNNIKLIFWIPPTHMDFQNSLKEYHLEDDDLRFRKDLSSLGEVYDYNYPNELTTDKESFKDPLHFTHEIAILIRDEIFGSKPYLARKIVEEAPP